MMTKTFIPGMLRYVAVSAVVLLSFLLLSTTSISVVVEASSNEQQVSAVSVLVLIAASASVSASTSSTIDTNMIDDISAFSEMIIGQQQQQQRNNEYRRRQQQRKDDKRKRRKLQEQQQQQQYKAFTSSEELRAAVDIVLEYRANRRPVETNENENEYDNENYDSLTTIYGPIEIWDVSLIVDFTALFNSKRNPVVSNYTATYDLDLSHWPIGGGQHHPTNNSEADSDSESHIILADMFYGATHMNFNVAQWETSRVTRFQGMFELTDTFTGDGLETWNVEQGIYFMSMFSSATGLHEQLDVELATKWKPAFQQQQQQQSPQVVISFKNMFRDSSFQGNLCHWQQYLDPTKVIVEGMFSGSDCLNPTTPLTVMTSNSKVVIWDPTTSFCGEPCSDNDGIDDYDMNNVVVTNEEEEEFDVLAGSGVLGGITTQSGVDTIATSNTDADTNTLGTSTSSFPIAINGRGEGTPSLGSDGDSTTSTTGTTDSTTSSSTSSSSSNEYSDENSNGTSGSTSSSNTENTSSSSQDQNQHQNQNHQSPNQQQNQSQSQQRQKPNVLFIMTDQQRFDTIRYVQDQLTRYDPYFKIETPHLDKLLQSGVYFENAYCQCPVCGPARTSLRTGCTIERTGIQHNDMTTEYKNNAQNTQNNINTKRRVEQLRGIDDVLVEQYGYLSNHYYGKFHMPDVLATQIHANDYDYSTQQHYFLFDSEGRKLKRYLQHSSAILGEINITDWTTDTMLEGEQLETYSGQPYTPIELDTRARHHSPTNTPLERSEDNDFRSYEVSQSNEMGLYAHPHNYTSTYYTGDVANKALRKLMTHQVEQKKQQKRKTILRQQQRQRTMQEQESQSDTSSLTEEETILVDPWFLTVSFHSPHPPMIPSWKHLEKYWLQQHELFTPLNKNMNKDEHMSDTSYSAITDRIPEYANDELIKEWTAIYYALIEEIDDQIGVLLDTLDNNDDDDNDNDNDNDDEPTIRDNTLIVFTSDHGEMLGSHGKRDKNNFFEESARVPLFMSYPLQIKPGTHVTDLVGHIDVFATILDYASSPLPSSSNTNKRNNNNDSDGISLRPLIENQEINQHYDNNVAIVEWDFRKPVDDDLTNNENRGDPNYLADRVIDERPAYLVRKGPYKLMIQKLASSRELDMMYNLETDPYEVQNLIGRQFGTTINNSTIAKAEHLRCLLLDWMNRHNNGNHNNNNDHSNSNGGAAVAAENYFSDPVSNFNQGSGDIEEITRRQSWKRTGFRVSDDTRLRFGSIAWNDKVVAVPKNDTLLPLVLPTTATFSRGATFSEKPATITTAITTTMTGIRHEYLYLGSREEGSIYDLKSIHIHGTDSAFFRIDLQQENGMSMLLPKRIGYGDCMSLRITFFVDETNREQFIRDKEINSNNSIGENDKRKTMDAVLVLSVSGQPSDISIELDVDLTPAPSTI